MNEISQINFWNGLVNGLFGLVGVFVGAGITTFAHWWHYEKTQRIDTLEDEKRQRNLKALSTLEDWFFALVETFDDRNFPEDSDEKFRITLSGRLQPPAGESVRLNRHFDWGESKEWLETSDFIFRLLAELHKFSSIDNQGFKVVEIDWAAAAEVSTIAVDALMSVEILHYAMLFEAEKGRSLRTRYLKKQLLRKFLKLAVIIGILLLIFAIFYWFEELVLIVRENLS